jgi:hypothetical protein
MEGLEYHVSGLGVKKFPPGGLLLLAPIYSNIRLKYSGIDLEHPPDAPPLSGADGAALGTGPGADRLLSEGLVPALFGGN